MERCALFAKHFDYLSELLVKSYLTDKKAMSSVDSLVLYLKSIPDVRDEEYSNILYQYMLSMALSDSKRLSAYMREHADILTGEQMAILSTWRDRPAFFLLFTVIEEREKELFLIEDPFSKKTYLVQSQGVAFMQKMEETRKKRYLTLVYDNGLCLETANLLHYASASTEELRFFFSALDGPRFAEAGVDGVLKANPKGLSIYRKFSRDLSFSSDGQEIRIHYADVGPLDYCFDPSVWDVEKNGRLRAYTLVDSNELLDRLVGHTKMDFCCSRRSIKVFVLSQRTILLTIDEPSFAIGKTILGLASEIAPTTLGVVLLSIIEKEWLKTPWFPFTFFRDEAVQHEVSEEVERMNELMARYIEVTNRGAPFDVGREAARYGVAPSAANQRIAHFKELLQQQFWSVPESERMYEITDCPLPPPIVRRTIGDSLSVNMYFDLDLNNLGEIEQLSVSGGERYGTIFDVTGLFEALEKGFIAVLGDDGAGHFSLNMLLWIALSSFSTPLLVRSLALEIYKVYPHVNTLMDFDRYVELFSKAVVEHLVLMHLFSVQERPRKEARDRGLYTIQTTAPLRALITTMDIE